MNEFQEALDNLKKEHDTFAVSIFALHNFKIIQELVDKVTPMKLVYREFMRNTPQHVFRESCPDCNMYLYKIKQDVPYHYDGRLHLIDNPYRSFTQSEIDNFPPEIKGAVECGFLKKVEVEE